MIMGFQSTRFLKEVWKKHVRHLKYGADWSVKSGFEDAPDGMLVALAIGDMSDREFEEIFKSVMGDPK